MTRESAWRLVRSYYAGHAVEPDTLVAAMNKLNYRRVAKAKLHPLPAHVRAKVNSVLLFNLGVAIGQRRAA